MSSFRVLWLVAVLACLSASAFADECSSRKVKVEETTFSSPIHAGPYFLNPPAYSTVIAVAQQGELYLSTDSGRSWRETMLSGLVNGTHPGVYTIHIAPDEKHVILVGRENNLWISRDGAASFHHVAAPGRMQHFTFHPTRSDWVLAIKNGCDDYSSASCSSDLYISTDTGANWKQLRTYVWDYEWSVAPPTQGGDRVEPIIVVWERDEKSGRQDHEPFTSSVYRSATLFRTPPELIMYDATGFLVVKEHIFIARGGAGEGLHLLSSEDQGLTFHPIRFPLGLKESRYTILDVNEGSTFVNVEHGSNWGNVYSSNAFYNDFVLSLKHNPRGWGPGSTEFRPVEGIEGIYLASVYTDITETNSVGRRKQTVISYDKGAMWLRLPQPIDVECKSSNPEDCRLNLDFSTWYTRDEAVGIIIGNGNLGPYLEDNPKKLRAFVSRDAGWTWEDIDNSTGTFSYEIGNRGAVILSAEMDGVTDHITYSLDEGRTWISCAFKDGQDTGEKVDIDWIKNDPNAQSRSFLAIGTKGQKGVSLYIDFSAVLERDCRGFESPGTDTSDYEYWEPSDTKGDLCLLGRHTRYVRRKRDAMCWNVVSKAIVDGAQFVVKNCTCTKEDYECDWCFTRNKEGKCELEPACVGYDPKAEPFPCEDYWYETRGYRRVPGDTCDPTLSKENFEPIRHKCTPPPVKPTPKNGGDSGGYGAGLLTVIIIIVLLAIVVGGLYALSGRNAAVRSFVTMCVPERFLPELVIPRANYGIFAANIDDDEDLHRDAKVIDLADSDDEDLPPSKPSAPVSLSDDEDDAAPSAPSAPSPAPGANVGTLI